MVRNSHPAHFATINAVDGFPKRLKSEQAYEKVQDIANKAVSASRREIYAAPPLSRSGIPVRDDEQG